MSRHVIGAIVTDIEGTTSSISFVHEVLFPYARARMQEFVMAHADDPHCAPQLQAVRDEVGRPEMTIPEIAKQLNTWIEQDRKITPLKALQGIIWEQGYRDGDFTGHVYPDAAEQLRRWHAQGIRLYVYSSGSIHAQKLLFGHSDAGDLTPLFSGYFDTTTGAKQDAESYRRIVDALGLPAAEILFLSDIAGELDAAREAGMQTRCLVRPGGSPAPGHQAVSTFDQIDLGTA